MFLKKYQNNTGLHQTLRSSLRCGARGRVAPFRYAHPDITAIIWNFPAENSQILLRRTSDNPNVKL